MAKWYVELKICEGCGTLWIRSQGQGVYCRECVSWLAEFPAPLRRSRRGRRPSASRTAGVCVGGAR